ncbi:putative Na+/H+ antiporter [Massilia sp. YIM B02769]|uniref:putative Na+/H+ antiporter n=1 Tax=Massilia sp. YIM B02769 TaxID=3050129 RepID=UPI0025B63390|nr:putative Na+/H+ antiporter [Massilia sp. YIM B02769]MDN4057232.1 putative Na+/H+ antiporter [Massilia sp. YIM B02769]
MTTMQLVGAILFACALIHTFSAKGFEMLAHRHPRHAGLLGEVEVVFGFWAMVLIVAMALIGGPGTAVDYAESRQFTEPLFVFVVMVIAASRPILDAVRALLRALARFAPLRTEVALAWLGLALVPLAGSLITEPAAMTLAALMLAPQVFRPGIPEGLKYGALGVLFVNVSIGGTLTAYAAPPVLMVASTWGWDSAYMFLHLGWRAAVAVLVNATVITLLLRRYLAPVATTDEQKTVPLKVSAIHLAFLAAVVLLAHHPVFFLGLFMLFLGFTQAYQRYQDPLILKEGLLVGFFLAGLVVLGGMQQWWLQPVVSSLGPTALFFGALGLTAITDNAALTYLGSLIAGLSEHAQYMLVAGAVAGGGLTVIANAPNPAGAALLKHGFADESIGALGLLGGALGPTAVAALLFLI